MLRIKFVEAFQNEFGVFLVLGENDGLADAFAAVHLYAALHEVLKHEVHGFLVEDKVVQRLRGDEVRNDAFFGKVLKVVFIAFLVFVGKFIVGDALREKFRRDFIVVVGHQHVILMHGGVVVVGIGGNAVFELEEFIGVSGHFGFRRSGQAEENGVEVFKDGAIFFEDAPVTFVDDDEIEVRGREQHVAVFVLCAVDGVHDGGVGGEHDSRGGVVLVGAKIAKGHVRQVRFEVVLCLRDKRRSVGEEEHVGDVVPPAQHIDQAGGRSGFAGACGHDEKMLAHAAAAFLAYGAYGCLLIVAVCDVVAYADAFKRQFG